MGHGGHGERGDGDQARLERLAGLGGRVAEVTHELRNALGVLDTSLELVRRALAKHPEAAAEVGPQLDRMARQVDAGKRIVQDALLEVRGSDRGAVEARSIVYEVLAGVRRPELVAIDVQAEATDARVDADTVRQVLLNLLRNALEAFAGGPGHVLVELTTRDGEVTVAVHDDGPGIPPAVRARLFEPFVTGKASGTGLGLALCRRLAVGQGGRLEVADAAPHGTVFRLVLPLR